MTKLLITSATILSMDDAIGALHKGDIYVEDGLIVAVGENLSATYLAADVAVIDATGMIATPGLINAHIHMWQTAVRGFGVDWTGIEHHFHMQTEFVPAYTPEDMHASQYLGALNLLNGGTTTVYEWCHGSRTPDHTDAAIAGLIESGIRSVFVHGTVKTLPLPGEPHFSRVPHPRAEATRLRNTYSSDDGKLTIALGLLGPEYAALDVCEQDFKLARDLDVWSSAHAHGKPGKVEGGYVGLAKAGFLYGKHNAVHMNSATDEELKVLVDNGCTVTATSQTEVNGGGREPIISRIAALGGTPSIGTDSEANTSADMLEAMRWSLVMQRFFNAQAKAKAAQVETQASTNLVSREKPLPDRILPSAKDALYWATMGNAKALGLDHKIGSLSIGKQADIVLFTSKGINLAPAVNPFDAIVSFANASNVDVVVVAGEIMKRKGVLTQAAAATRAAEDISERARRILRETGNSDMIA